MVDDIAFLVIGVLALVGLAAIFVVVDQWLNR